MGMTGMPRPHGLGSVARRLMTAVLFLSLGTGLAAQERSLPVEPAPPTGAMDAPSRVLDLDRSAVSDLLRTTLARDLTEGSLDDVYLLARWKSGWALPLVEEALAATPSGAGTGGARVQILLDLVAYAADTQTVDTLSRLADQAPGPAVETLQAALDYAWGRGTAFRLAYDALERGAPALRAPTAQWVRGVVAEGQGLDQWLTVLRERQSPKEAAPLADDPLIRQVFEGRIPPGLLRVLGMPEEPR